jgi:dTDP-4-amino-4,6-dideoxygalactose transaminase
MPIHLFGQMCEMERIQEIARKHNLHIIEDAAQAVGCTRNGTPAGGFGVGAGFSFYVTKNLGAAGDAGMIITDDDQIAERCRSIKVHGMGRERYYYDYIGYTSRMDEVQAAVLRVKLKRLDSWNAKRTQFAAIYCDELANAGLQLPQTLEGNTNTWHQFPVRVQDREAVMASLKEDGVDSMVYYPVPLHFHAPYEGFGGGKGSLPETERAAAEILNLPIQPHLSEEQVRHAARSLVKATKKERTS